MNLKFSVITPSLNQGRFIRDTIESVLNQNYTNFEHIIIDGGSSDNTISILKEYPHLKWVSGKDKGPSSAINKGFNLATGDVFSWLNSDDFYDENVFHTVNKYFIKNKTEELLFGNLTIVDINGNILYRDKTHKITKDYLVNISADVVRQPCSFFSSKLFKEVGRLDENLNLVFDYDLFIRMLECTQCGFINMNLAFYREYPATLTRRNISKQAKEIFKVSRKHGGNIVSKLNYTNIKKILFPAKYIEQRVHKDFLDTVE